MPTIAKINAILSEIRPLTDSQDIVTSRMAQNIRVSDKSIELDLIGPKHMQNTIEDCATNIDRLLKQKTDVEEVRVTIKLLKSAQQATQPSVLKNIKHIIAVSSCKGGVGKSTIAANLAVELKNQGHSVGIMDADIFGPSLPTLFNIPDAEIKAENNIFKPIEKDGLKLMSFGFLLGDQAAVMRGPIVTRYIQQLLVGTEWGELDYLLIDMPPGTGDVHLTITQTIRLNGAIIITTPHTLSLIDVARGILMFEKVNVPILGIIENMAFFKDPANNKHHIFGESSSTDLAERFGLSNICEIPILPELSQSAQSIKPNDHIKETANLLTEAVENTDKMKNALPNITFNEAFITLEWPEGETISINNRLLRLNSQDALSVDEISGKRLIKEKDIPDNIQPVQIMTLGNYAIGINWSDGHNAGIYPYSLIKKLAT